MRHLYPTLTASAFIYKCTQAYKCMALNVPTVALLAA